MLVSALLAFVAATAVLGGTVDCDPTSVRINTESAMPRVNIKCSNAQNVNGDSVIAYSFLMSSATDRDYGQMMAQVASVAKVNSQSIFIKYTEDRDSSACGTPSTCRPIVTVGV